MVGTFVSTIILSLHQWFSEFFGGDKQDKTADS